jgi:hypothetical protein
MSTPGRFLFGGQVVAAGVRLERPRFREVRAALVLPGIGGDASVRDGPAVLAGLVRFAHASSRVIGEQDGNTCRTRVSCVIHGLEMPGVLRADRLAAELTSTHGDGHAFHEDTLTVEGLRVDGHPYQVNAPLLQTVRSGPTLAQLKSAVARDPAAARSVTESAGGGLVCSLVEGRAAETAGEPHRGSPGLSGIRLSDGRPLGGLSRRFEMDGNTVDVFLGEYRVGERSRRLTMLRVDFEPTGQAAEPRHGSLVFLEIRIDAGA